MTFAACLLSCFVFAAPEAPAWTDVVLQVPYPLPGERGPSLELLRQDYEQLEKGRSVVKTPLKIGSQRFERGLGTHSASHIRISSPVPIEGLSAWIGVDANERTQGGRGSVIFKVEAGGRDAFHSAILRGGQDPVRIELALGGPRQIDLIAEDAGDGPACDHADWAEASMTLQGGKRVLLDDLETTSRSRSQRYPFSFTYDNRPSDEMLSLWKSERSSEAVEEGRRRVTTTWSDPTTGLRIRWEATCFPEAPAVDWVLYFENTGATDTPILEGIQALDYVFEDRPCASDPKSIGVARDTAPISLHRTNGSPADPTDFEPRRVRLNPKEPQTLGGGGGRSSNKDLPFLKLEGREASLVLAVGWSGQWAARVESIGPGAAHLTAGMERTHLLLHPGEKVRTPRILLLRWEGDTLEANARFRILVAKHYSAKRHGPDGKEIPLLPVIFSNTCFTRGGGWLNECNASNQISLIDAYAPLGLEAVVTDAGWFEGGWPAGAGNWTPRKDAYPQGMGPVAAAAKRHGMVYGLWFEPERVVTGTWIQRHRPEWVLSNGTDTYLLDFGNPHARDYFFGIVRSFFELPGFRFYRQDFNMDPLPYWQAADGPDRQGIAEIKYIEGLYAHWDRIAREWPDSLREECASGGRRIDIETIQRMHVHQESDYWFDDEVDQAQIWGLSQYLPNGLFTTPIVRLDDYTFHSTLATSLIVGWIADAPGFDRERARRLLDRYRSLRHLLNGAWYPLLPYTRDPAQWMASQYHRPDLGVGLLLVFRHAESPYRTIEVSLHGLDESADYELASDRTGVKVTKRGAELMCRLLVTLEERRSSDLIVYKTVQAR